jgi:hypothetical protein
MKPLHFRWLTLPGIQEEMNRAAKAWSAFQRRLIDTQHLASAISLALVLFSLTAPAWAQQSAADQGVPVQMIVTLEPKHTKVIPEITQQDVMVYQGHDRRTVTGWIPVKGDKARLALAILIDDSAGFSLGSQLNEIRTFIQAQAPTTLVAVGYMQNGTVFMAQNFTQDHTAAAKSVRLAQGFYGAEGSPYLSLSEFIKRWNADPAVPRREILMVTSGIDNVYMGVLDNPYVDAAIQDAQCAGIVIYSIYTPSAGHLGHSYFRTTWGQNYLSEITEATGGEAYDLLGPQGAVSFAPYFKQVNEQLPNQFLLTFLAKPQKKAGTESVKVTSEIHDVDFVHADKVCVPASPGE